MVLLTCYYCCCCAVCRATTYKYSSPNISYPFHLTPIVFSPAVSYTCSRDKNLHLIFPFHMLL